MSAGRPRVSVCIVTYNQAPYIEDCVLSALAQAGDFDLEVLVGNDASTDTTKEQLDALLPLHADRLSVFHREANLGPIANIQDLVRRATGDYIAHLDGDDAWLPGKLREQLGFLRAHADCPAVYTNGVVVETSGTLRGPFTNSHPPLLSLAYMCARGNFLMHSSTLYRAHYKGEVLQLPSSAIDYRLHLSFARSGPLGFVDMPLAVYRFATATSLVRTSKDWVQRERWAALRDASGQLPDLQRRWAMAHFVAGALLSCISGETRASLLLARDTARESGYWSVSLFLLALPAACAIATHGLIRRLFIRLGARRRLAEYYRV